MRRRDFLSLVSCAALAAIVPRPKYCFLNGVWQREVTISYDASMGKDQSCLMLTESNPGNYGSIWVREVWHGEEAARLYRKIANGEWESIPNVNWHGRAPFVVADFGYHPWEPTATLQPEDTHEEAH